ncbi:uncharacterized protein EI90DRAFT_3152407 [Cantharellus anzutake]|uniref:uncharacterized protein n=1 Tax=Cantharellus anzutake TaxID=1750568 RepID=UPI001904594F|nr:uncharacterized protein EI90DRAFT_3152407 [Cantharellus anzutake]KAF8337003.1 hypothetical protein EI90DRAFT_3152407 [Cantharellus anzutake]
MPVRTRNQVALHRDRSDHNDHQPLYKLPPEIISEIFLYGLPDVLPAMMKMALDSLSDLWNERIRYLTLITGVCALVRGAILCDPLFWNVIGYAHNRGQETLVETYLEAMSVFIRRSRNVNVHLVLVDSDPFRLTIGVETLQKLLYPILPRCSTLVYRAYSPLPFFPLPGKLKALKTLVIAAVGLHRDGTYFPIFDDHNPGCSLEDLGLETWWFDKDNKTLGGSSTFASVRTLTCSFQNGHLVVDLHVEGFWSGWDFDITTQTPREKRIIIPSLISAQVALNASHGFFQLVNAPQLQHLCLSPFRPTKAFPFISSRILTLHPSLTTFPSLKTIRIDMSTCPAKVMERLLYNGTSLVMIEMLSANLFTLDTFLDILSNSNTALPLLSFVRIVWTFDWRESLHSYPVWEKIAKILMNSKERKNVRIELVRDPAQWDARYIDDSYPASLAPQRIENVKGNVQTVEPLHMRYQRLYGSEA